MLSLLYFSSRVRRIVHAPETALSTPGDEAAPPSLPVEPPMNRAPQAHRLAHELKLRSVTFCVAAALMARVARSFAQEDYGSYRHEFYREDDNRMSIDTDSVGFDLGLGSHVRMTGQLVLDAISGATPSGAPPQNQWPYPSFNDYYTKAYNTFFQNAINDPNNLVLYQSGYFASYQAYTNYIAVNNPQLRTQATNNANASYQALTSNPSYHNNTVPLTQLHDQRRAGSVAFPITFGIQTITPEVSISEESDYHSYGFALDYAIQLNKKNTTLNAGWSHDSDRVRDYTLVNWQGKVSDDVLIGINQLLTPKSYFTVDLTYAQETGYLADPYRGVMTVVGPLSPQLNPADPALQPEVRPPRRTKEIIYTSYNQFFEPPNGSVELSYRFFHDSFGIFAQTLDGAWHQKLGKRLVFTPEIRYYYQTAATFYEVIFPDGYNMPAAYSSDYRLSRLQTFTMSASLNYRLQKHFSIDLSYMRYIMQGLDGLTSQSAYPSANVYSLGGRIWF